MTGGNAAPLQIDPPRLRRLRDLRPLEVADATDDVRGWEILAHDGRVLGVVSDLLVDAERLVAEFLVVTMAEGVSAAAGAEALVPIAALEARYTEKRLTSGRGLRPIQLRYPSTVANMAWTVAVTAAVLSIAWGLGAL